MTAHSPAPWRVEEPPETPVLVVIDDDGEAVAEIIDRPTDEERAANAALIASAPCLLAALKPLAFCAPETPPPGVAADDWRAAVAAARAAVARATGAMPATPERP